MKAFEKNIRKVEPYVPGEQPQRKVIKLNTCLLYTSSTNIVISDVIFQITCKLRNAESMNDEVMNGKPDRE